MFVVVVVVVLPSSPFPSPPPHPSPSPPPPLSSSPKIERVPVKQSLGHCGKFLLDSKDIYLQKILLALVFKMFILAIFVIIETST